ncbi:MAG: DMT family transporter [Prevotella sp.]|nr:DMT family transporter [Prevotella sp.]
MIYHLLAFLTVTIWGSTFVFTKMLLQNGLSPAHIFTLRFAIAYFLLVIVELAKWARRQGAAPRFLSATLHDELMMVGLGVSGGSLYFLTENAALLYTTATNTSLIVCSCPLFAALLIGMVYRSERFNRAQLLGSLLACVGMAIVVLNGHFVLHLSPLGDLLAFSACLCWAVYSLLMIPIGHRYDTVFITRKVFFYGLLTMIPYYLLVPGFPPLALLLQPDVIANLLFLGCIASLLCFLVWTWLIKKLGAVITTNYVYINPIATILFAWWLLGEQITLYFLLGSAMILVGMYLCERQRR